MNTASQMLLNSGFSEGDQNISSALTANGTANHFINGILLPFLLEHLSLMDATTGSDTASIMWPTAFIRPITVRIPDSTYPCVISVGSPDAAVG